MFKNDIVHDYGVEATEKMYTTSTAAYDAVLAAARQMGAKTVCTVFPDKLFNGNLGAFIGGVQNMVYDGMQITSLSATHLPERMQPVFPVAVTTQVHMENIIPYLTTQNVDIEVDGQQVSMAIIAHVPLNDAKWSEHTLMYIGRDYAAAHGQPV